MKWGVAFDVVSIVVERRIHTSYIVHILYNSYSADTEFCVVNKYTPRQL